MATSATRTAFIGGFTAEFAQLRRARLFVALTIVQAITFLLLVTLFGLTGSRAPTAVVLSDKGPLAGEFLGTLKTAHHSFALTKMSLPVAMKKLRHGEIVAVINIQAGFTDSISRQKTTVINVAVDNVDTDMTDDIQRALPSAIVAFGRERKFPGITVHTDETDLVDHDTGFIPYLVVSGLILDVFVIAGILGAIAVAREFESGTVNYLRLAPHLPMVPIAGRIAAAVVVSLLAMLLPVLIVILCYGVVPNHPLEMIAALILCTITFAGFGAALGAVLKRTLPVASLVFGLALPLYMCSGSLEPSRFDGSLVWFIAHFSPVYYAVGVFEHAFHSLQVTPETVGVNVAALVFWAAISIYTASAMITRGVRGHGSVA
jgi:ABC-type transport system involved in multi-copper enzyme maturation permease subunit